MALVDTIQSQYVNHTDPDNHTSQGNHTWRYKLVFITPSVYMFMLDKCDYQFKYMFMLDKVYHQF